MKENLNNNTSPELNFNRMEEYKKSSESLGEVSNETISKISLLFSKEDKKKMRSGDGLKIDGLVFRMHQAEGIYDPLIVTFEEMKNPSRPYVTAIEITNKGLYTYLSVGQAQYSFVRNGENPREISSVKPLYLNRRTIHRIGEGGVEITSDSAYAREEIRLVELYEYKSPSQKLLDKLFKRRPQGGEELDQNNDRTTVPFDVLIEINNKTRDLLNLANKTVKGYVANSV